MGTKSPGPQRCQLILQQCLAIQLGKPGHTPEDFWMYDSGYMIFQVRQTLISLMIQMNKCERKCNRFIMRVNGNDNEIVIILISVLCDASIVGCLMTMRYGLPSRWEMMRIF